MSSAHIWWFVSDLHLGAGPDHRGTAAALVEFLGVVADTRPETERSIVLLGDSFDLPADDSAAAALSAIARRHPEVFSALGGRGAPGWTSRWCAATTTPRWHARPCGRPSAAAVSRRGGRAAPAGGAVHVHPWWLHEPHVFHAEHGHQHHDVHRIPTLLEQSVSSPPAQSLLTAWSATAGGGPIRRLGAVTRAAVATARGEQRAAAAPYLALVDAEASRAALPVPAARALVRVSRFRTLPTAVGVSRRVLSRRIGVGPRGPGLARAAARVHCALDRNGASVPVVIFGHTHRAEKGRSQGRPRATSTPAPGATTSAAAVRTATTTGCSPMSGWTHSTPRAP